MDQTRGFCMLDKTCWRFLVNLNFLCTRSQKGDTHYTCLYQDNLIFFFIFIIIFSSPRLQSYLLNWTIINFMWFTSIRVWFYYGLVFLLCHQSIKPNQSCLFFFLAGNQSCLLAIYYKHSFWNDLLMFIYVNYAPSWICF